MASNRNWLQSTGAGVLGGLVLVSVIVYLGAATMNKVREGRYIGRPESQRDTITIQGEGKVTATPDIGQITISIVKQNRDVNKAQEQNITQFNQLIEALKKEGIDKKDMTTTNYTVYPIYDWSDGTQVFKYYEVRQSLSVKIRDLEKAGSIITVAGQNGVNEVSGLTFTIDDPEGLKEEARKLALENAQKKADNLADLAGVKLGKIVSFSETSSDYYPPQPYFYADKAQDGRGGANFESAPSFEAGSQDIRVYATIQYEIY